MAPPDDRCRQQESILHAALEQLTAVDGAARRVARRAQAIAGSTDAALGPGGDRVSRRQDACDQGDAAHSPAAVQDRDRGSRCAIT